MRTMRADLTWLTAEAGGRSAPPSGTGPHPYTTTVRLLDCDEPWPASSAWSLVVEKERAVGDDYHWIAAVRFLVPEAPEEAMRPGGRFELYEGAKCVAIGHFVRQIELASPQSAVVAGNA